MKYIIFENSFVAIFSESLKHCDIAMGISDRPTSAGFCNIEVGKAVYTHGESISLGIANKKGDADIILRAIL